MPEDKRGKRIVCLAHCILNQNVKAPGCAYHAAALREVVNLFLDEGIGIRQLPCPELLYVGLDRNGAGPDSGEESSKDASPARRAITDEGGIIMCSQLAAAHGVQLDEYAKHGIQVVGIIGINGSPACGVNSIIEGGKERPGEGVYMRELSELQSEKGYEIPMRGIDDSKPEEAAAACAELIKKRESENI